MSVTCWAAVPASASMDTGMCCANTVNQVQQRTQASPTANMMSAQRTPLKLAARPFGADLPRPTRLCRCSAPHAQTPPAATHRTPGHAAFWPPPPRHERTPPPPRVPCAHDASHTTDHAAAVSGTGGGQPSRLPLIHRPCGHSQRNCGRATIQTAAHIQKTYPHAIQSCETPQGDYKPHKVTPNPTQ